METQTLLSPGVPQGLVRSFHLQIAAGWEAPRSPPNFSARPQFPEGQLPGGLISN